jgi:ribose/xylose/arabinose/galactoside ABC-type transport system permease subunit
MGIPSADARAREAEIETAHPASTGRVRRAFDLPPLAALRRVEERGVVLALVVVFVGATFTSSSFLQRENVYGILQDVTFLGVIVVGLAFALVAGEIDISVGSVYGLTSVVTAVLLRDGHPLGLAVLAGLATGLGCGLANGIAAWLIRVPAVIVTLATLGIYRGFALVVANSAPVTGLPENDFFFNSFGNGTFWGGFPWLALIFLAVALVGGLALARTAFGFRVYSVGSNPLAARLIGIGVTRVRVSVLALSGLCAGVAGVLSVSYLSGATATGGQGYELDALAAVIIGGVKLAGGRGTILGVVLGLFIVGIVRNMLVLTGVSPSWQQAVSGAVLVTAVALERVTRARETGR